MTIAHRIHLALSVSTALAHLAIATPPTKPAAQSAPARAAAQSGRISREIDSLLGNRTKPDPLPLVLPNPFLAAMSSGTARAAESSATADPEPQLDSSPAGNAAALARYASTLKIGGVLRMNGQLSQVVVNGVSRKEGDVITAKLDNTTVRIQVVRILPNELALKLGEAELTVKF